MIRTFTAFALAALTLTAFAPAGFLALGIGYVAARTFTRAGSRSGGTSCALSCATARGLCSRERLAGAAP
jgi:hypothetical protein